MTKKKALTPFDVSALGKASPNAIQLALSRFSNRHGSGWILPTSGFPNSLLPIDGSFNSVSPND